MSLRGDRVVMPHMPAKGKGAVVNTASKHGVVGLTRSLAVVFLASDAASDRNGVVLPVDNGWSAV
ncbi:hypothetical protein [Umezawaea tangerina]|uniref:Enoyl-ACP reductase-like protein n=1 Tax=Umezawaea tangerina TaxID=84725 RepID=A0A2T0TFN4_9PSEU|nr:hypothetical protein [Umezawaea tangerina]PRY44459.1 hypothetical protein CLV43_10224 [Umezawaea tangerina]